MKCQTQNLRMTLGAKVSHLPLSCQLHHSTMELWTHHEWHRLPHNLDPHKSAYFHLLLHVVITHFYHCGWSKVKLMSSSKKLGFCQRSFALSPSSAYSNHEFISPLHEWCASLRKGAHGTTNRISLRKGTFKRWRMGVQSSGPPLQEWSRILGVALVAMRERWWNMRIYPWNKRDFNYL